MNNKNCQLCKNYKDGYCEELELKPCYPEKGCDYFIRQDWHDVPSDEMTLEQARQAVKDLRKKLAEYLWQEPCEDAVSRVEVINGLQKICDECDSEFCGDCRIDTEGTSLDSAKEMLKRLPPVTPTRKKGKWRIKDGKESGYDVAGVKTWYIQIVCDRCGFIKTAIEGHCGQYNFCPNCGAKMVEPQESEEISDREPYVPDINVGNKAESEE